MSSPSGEPGDRRPRLDRPPSERYGPPAESAADDSRALDARLAPVAVVIGGVVGFLILGGMLAVTAGLIVLAVVLGWIVGLLVSPPARAALVALAAVVVGFVAIWAFGRVEGGVLDPITYLLEVEGPIVVGLSLIGAGGLAAAASR